MEKRHSIRLTLSALVLLCSASSRATELGDSTDTYQNQTVSTDVFVQGRTTLNISSITVTSTGDFTANAPNGIVIINPFEVQTGGTLELTVGHPYRIRYTYDAAGNRTNRKNE